jgi:hypothetical protein
MSDFDKFVATLNPEQLAQLKAALDQTASKPKPTRKPKTLPVSKTTNKSETKTVETFTTIKQESDGGRVPVKFKKNSWKDTGESRDDEELRTPKYDPTPRSREKAKKVEVECYVCGKTFYEDPRYIYGEYQRCSKCGKR